MAVFEDDKVQSQVKYCAHASQNSVPEIETLVKGIDLSDGQGKNVILKINTQIDNQEAFFTDSNGLDLLPRKKDYRQTFELQEKGDLTGNYYPINAMIGIEGKESDSEVSKSLYLLNDRPQGGTAWDKGSVELMIHRACMFDDDRGLIESLQEKGPDDKPL